MVLQHDHVDADQHILRVEAPRTAATAMPGSFAHIRCSDTLPMRRPLSIMRSSPSEGWVEFLYKSVGPGTLELANRVNGDRLSMMGPIGRGFEPNRRQRRPVLIGGGVGIPPMIFLSDLLLREFPDSRPIVFMGSEVAFPFPLRPSQILVDGLPGEAIACLPLLDDLGVPSRLASLQGFPGCYDGYVTELARQWLEGLGPEALGEVALFACGPTPMLKAVAMLARQFSAPCQICLEEFMACAVGGCAGCVVRVHLSDGVAMKRVCIDGPVFEANTIYPSVRP